MSIAIIVGSTRPGRAATKVTKWVEKAVAEKGIEAKTLDLLSYELPFLDEEISPQFNPNRTPNPAAAKWLEDLSKYDGYLVVLPEYNRSVPAALKNALDYIDYQVMRKPIALVGYGVTGGAQAVAHMRGITGGLLAVSVPEVTYINGMANDLFSEDGELDEKLRQNPYGPAAALNKTIDSLVWYADALKSARG